MSMPRASAFMIIRASQANVMELFRDYRRWPQLFPATIRGVRQVRRDAGRTALEIDHREGKVPNVITQVSPNRIDLWEDKRRYEGHFINRFDAVPEGTRYTVEAEIRPKGAAKLLGPLLKPYIRRQIVEYVLSPMRAAAEIRSEERRVD